MQVSILDIKLFERSSLSYDQSENQTNCCSLDNGAKSFIVIKALKLSKTSCYKVGFVPFNGTTSSGLEFKDSFAC